MLSWSWFSTFPGYRGIRRMASLESGVNELMTISNLTNSHCSTNMATNRGVRMNNISEGNSETESLIEQADFMELEMVEKRIWWFCKVVCDYMKVLLTSNTSEIWSKYPFRTCSTVIIHHGNESNLKWKFGETFFELYGPIFHQSQKSENFPDSKIFVAKTFRIKRLSRVNFQIRNKCA